LIAPISPFFADWLYNNLNKVTNRIDQTSVHLANYPSANLSIIDSDLEERMLMAQDISSLVLSIRKKISIKVRQPLKKILIPILNDAMKQQLELVAPIIINEVNIKEVEYLVDSEGFIKKKLKPNFKSLGAKLGAHMKAAANLITNFTQDQILELERNQSIQITINNELININLQDVEVIIDDIPGWSIASKGSLTVALDLTLTPELEMEGIARELVNRIQKIRKDSNFELTDRINVKIKADEKINAAINQYNDYICAEILSDDIETVTDLQEGIAIEVNEITYHVLISKN
jgi:isoleucyl-tRNA synthetase